MPNFNDVYDEQIMPEQTNVGYAGPGGNVVMIIISVLGIIINSMFGFDYLKNIISIKNRNNEGISAVEKILCMIAIVETFISVFWLINNIKSKSNTDTSCDVIAYFEIFLNLFDWLILSTSLYQIKIILLNPQEILESGKRVFKYIIGCLIVSLLSLAFSIPANLGGLSPMLTCFIRLENLEKVYQSVLFCIFFTIPLFCFAFGGKQVYLIMKSAQYKNDVNNRRFFMEYSYFVITYIISSILLILTYVIHFIIMHTNKDNINNDVYKFFIASVTFLNCATPLIVGVIRYLRTGLLKRILKCCKRRRRRNYSMLENDEELLLLNNERDEDYLMFNYEKKMLENLIVKYFTAVSFALGKSKYDDDEEETKGEDNGKDEPRHYKVDKDEILKDLDLSLNDDITVLKETNIDIEVTEYNISLFKKLRRLENLDEDKIIEMLQPKNGTNDLIQRKNDTLFINSSNKLLMLKKINKEKLLYFQRTILPHLYDYFSNNKNSLICRVFGLYRIKIDQNDEIYMALTYNIHESLRNNNNYELVRQEKLTESEIRQRCKSITKSVIYIPNDNLNNISVENKNDLTTNDISDNRTRSIFQVLLSDKENDELENIIDKEKEFLLKIGIKRYNYMIFQLRKSNMDLMNLSDRSSILKIGKKGESDGLIFNNIKKYEFKSTKANTIYCICINGI